MATRFNPLTDLINYLQTLREVPKTPELLSSIAEEICGRELDLACDQKGSKQLQVFLPSLPTSVYSKLLDLDIVTNAYGSHVVEHALSAQNLEITWKFLQAHFEVVATTSGASHVLRRAVAVAASASPPLFLEISENFAQLLEQQPGLLRQPHVAATLGNFANCPVVARLLENLEISSLLDDGPGSRVVEKALQLLAKIPDRKNFRAKLEELVQHQTRRNACFVIQETVPLISDADEMRILLKNLKIDINDSKSLAILQRVANRALEISDKISVQKKVMRKIKEIFGPDGTGKSVLFKILTLSKEEKKISEIRASPAGALLASTLLSFEKPEISDKAISDVLENLDWMLAAKSNMRVLETLFKFPHVAKELAKAMLALTGDKALENLAGDLKFGGSFLVAALWQGLTGEVELRKLISDRLLKIEGLKELNFKLWKICNLGAAQNTPEHFHDALVKQRKAKALLDNLFTPSQPPSKKQKHL